MEDGERVAAGLSLLPRKSTQSCRVQVYLLCIHTFLMAWSEPHAVF